MAATDLRSLGATAPARGLYEISKRFGGHRVLFGLMRGGQVSEPGAANDWQLPGPAARNRARVDAATMVEAGKAVIFQMELPLHEPWHRAPDTGGFWSKSLWWKVDIRSDDRLADVKWTWEFGRHRHLLVLARAAWSGDPSSLALLIDQLRSWVRQNPPEFGVHWYSNLEIALRAIVWLQILYLVGDQLPPNLREEMHSHLFHGGRHVLGDLPYTISSMRNNHMLGDALGLMAVGKAFERLRWWRIGHRLFEGQLARHMRPDGSMIEDSLSYHRFVTEMLSIRVLLGDAPRTVTSALRSSGELLARLGVFAGPVPQYGDWDEGRLLGSSQDPLNTAGSAALALALSGTGAPAAWREAYDECAWYAPEGEPVPVPDAVTDGSALGGGFARAAQGGWTAWLKAGGGTSHQHGDLCSTVVSVDGQWVVGDPGTGTYNGPIEQRNAFRTSGAHSVLRLEDTDQLGPHRAFRWLHKAAGAAGPPPVVEGAVVMWGVHNAYRRLDGGGRIARLVVLQEGAMTVADVSESGVGQRWDLTLPLHPDVEEEGGALRLPDGQVLQLLLPAAAQRVRGQEAPYSGWWSHTYGSAVPTTWLNLHGLLDGSVVWGVHRPGVAPASPLPNGLHVAGLDLQLAFTTEACTLSALRDGELQEVVYVRMPR